MQLITSYLDKYPHLEEMLKGGFLSLWLKIVSTILGFILTLVIARLLGAAEAGNYFLVLSVVALSAVLVRTGFDQLVTREVSSLSVNGEWHQINSLYSSVICWVIFTSVFVAIFLFVSGAWLADNIFKKPELSAVWKWLVWGVIPFSLYFLHGQFFQGIKQMPSFMFAQGLGLSLLLLLFIAIIWLSQIVLTASLLAVLYVIASFLVLLILVIVWWEKPGVYLASVTSLSKLMRSALTLWGIQAANQVLQWAALIALGAWTTSADVATFAVAHRTALLTSIVLMAVNSIAAPKFAAQYNQNDMLGLHQVAIWSARLMLVICLPVVGFLMMFPELVMGLFGSEFVAGSTVLMVLALGQLVNVTTGSVGFLLSMTGHERELLKSTVIAAVLMLVLCAWLIPAYGMMGAAVAQAVSLSFQMFISSWFVKRALGFMPMNIFAKV